MEGESSATAMIAATGFTGQFNSVQNSIPLWGSPKPWFFHQRPHPTSGCTLKLEASVPPPGAPGSVHSISNKRLVRKTALIASDCLFFGQREPTTCLFPEFEIDPQWDVGTTWNYLIKDNFGWDVGMAGYGSKIFKPQVLVHTRQYQNLRACGYLVDVSTPHYRPGCQASAWSGRSQLGQWNHLALQLGTPLWKTSLSDPYLSKDHLPSTNQTQPSTVRRRALLVPMFFLGFKVRRKQWKQ